MASSINLPSVVNTLARLVIVIGTTLAFHTCMARPNPPPSIDKRKRASGLENAVQSLLRPLAALFSLGPAIIELTVVLARLAAPPAYNIVAGTCAERIAFDTLALVGFTLGLWGMCIRLWCYGVMGQLFTFELALLPDHKLITTGPYAFVRHPSYTGGLLGLLGMTLANVSRGSWTYECGVVSWWGIGWGIFCVVSACVIVERCPREDEFLREAFKEEWDAWSKRVRWWLVPWVF